MAQHTPGPWMVDPKYPLCVRPCLRLEYEHRLPDGTIQTHGMIGNHAVTNIGPTDSHVPLYGQRDSDVLAIMEADFTNTGRYKYVSYDQAVANARLIATAPDLLVALEGIDEAARAGDTMLVLHRIDEARTALRKARGEEPTP